MTQKKRFVHFNKRVRTGETQTRITERARRTFKLIKRLLFIF